MRKKVKEVSRLDDSTSGEISKVTSGEISKIKSWDIIRDFTLKKKPPKEIRDNIRELTSSTDHLVVNCDGHLYSYILFPTIYFLFQTKKKKKKIN